MNLEKLKSKLYEKNSLSYEEAEFLFEKILTGEIDEIDLTNILLALSLKGESSDEIAAAINVIDNFKRRFERKISPAVDTCGTGGDGKKSFNISTAVAITVSAGDVPVVKHGNSAQSGVIGSADILEKFSIPVKIELQRAKKYFQKHKFVFLYAPYYHPAIKKVAQARKRLKIRTIFNFIGPFVNPANPDFQIIGIGDRKKLQTIIDAVKKSNKNNVIIYSSKDGYDEISSFAPTECYEINGEVNKFEINPEEFFKPFKMPIVNNEKVAKDIFEKALSGKDDKLKKIVAINCAPVFYKIKSLDSLKEGYDYALEILNKGKAKEKLEELKEYDYN